jgi:hypothetical protein
MDEETGRPKPGDRDEDEISEEVLQWISGGDAHGCPACPHTALAPGVKKGSHILVDGSIFEDGTFIRKV